MDELDAFEHQACDIGHSGCLFNKTNAMILSLKNTELLIYCSREQLPIINNLPAGKRSSLYEAQAVPNIGKILKLMIDGISGITMIATGSSSFDLVYRTGEPLVGRNIVYQVHPWLKPN